MAFVTGFEQDIFISYAQVDNTPEDRNGKEVRWVSYLKEQLQKREAIQKDRTFPEELDYA